MKKFLSVVLLMSTLVACKDKEVNKEIAIIDPDSEAAKCKIVSNTRASGITYSYTYSGTKVMNIGGFSDFDSFIWNGIQLQKAINSRDKSYEVDFTYNQAGQLSEVIFVGKDSQGRAFSNPSTLKYNSAGQIREILFNWPTLDKVSTYLNYDERGNILNISGEINNKLQNLLINNSFDDKKSPFQEQKIGQVLTYFMIYALLNNGENLTYFVNNNNVTSCEINVNNIKRKIGYEYKYNPTDYPKEANLSISENNRIKAANEYFEYKCGL